MKKLIALLLAVMMVLSLGQKSGTFGDQGVYRFGQIHGPTS